jgi:hypothetical protein
MASLFLLKAIFIFKIQMNGLIFKFYELLLKETVFLLQKNNSLRIKFYFCETLTWNILYTA